MPLAIGESLGTRLSTESSSESDRASDCLRWNRNLPLQRNTYNILHLYPDTHGRFHCVDGDILVRLVWQVYKNIERFLQLPPLLQTEEGENGETSILDFYFYLWKYPRKDVA
jgi:hypothetical protein